MPQLAATWTPEPSDLELLPEPGRRFVEEMLARYEFDFSEGTLLIEAAIAIPRLDAVRSLSRVGHTLREAAAIERVEIAWQK